MIGISTLEKQYHTRHSPQMGRKNQGGSTGPSNVPRIMQYCIIQSEFQCNLKVLLVATCLETTCIRHRETTVSSNFKRTDFSRLSR
jgi:hypothetical protein